VNPWHELFAPAPQNGVTVRLRVLRKQGRPFLALPPGGRAAAAALTLYPAQTPRARAAKRLLRWLLRVGVAPGAHRLSLTLSPADPFVQFLASLSQEPSPLPGLAILAGNPGSPGRRFVVLVLDARQRPVAVAKAGLSREARELVGLEKSFLEAIAGKPGLPTLRGAFQSDRLDALALDFVPGDSPRPRHDPGLPALLWPWVEPAGTVPLAETQDWRQLEAALAGTGGLPPALAGPLRALTLRPVIAHGDLAPWNIKVSPQGAWTVLDWERGHRPGIAGWDWFHYVLQRAILVERQPVRQLVRRLDHLLHSEPFQRYAAHTGIAGFERELVAAYLLHSAEVVKPAEGLPRTLELFHALAPTLGPRK
jgi:hypothetical protein